MNLSRGSRVIKSSLPVHATEHIKYTYSKPATYPEGLQFWTSLINFYYQSMLYVEIDGETFDAC